MFTRHCGTGILRLTHLIIYAALTVFSLAHSAQSQDLEGFDRASFGSVVLSRTQAVGADIQLESAVGLYNNEPIRNYGSDSVFAQIGKSVGRLDVLTDKGNFPCTAFIVSKKYILTNYHCSFGMLDNERVGATRIDAVQFVAGYTQTGIDEGTKKYTVIPTPVEFSAELDYAVLEVLGNPSQEYGKLKLVSLVPNDRAPFWVIGHPRGEGQRISREKCRASSPAVSKTKLLHTCDTLPGNSGSPVIDAGLQVVVALHHAGISNDSVNAAILMSEILRNSTVLAAYLAPNDVPKAEPKPIKTLETMACDALYGAAAEAKACYAYDVYMESCSAHTLAPMARGYVKKFCKVQEVAEVEEAPKTTVVKKTCNDKPEVCPIIELCFMATAGSDNSKTWAIGSFASPFVKEAKKRGLTCGVKNAAIKTAFINQGVLKRKQLQYALKKLSYYKSTIDALYGPGTEKALTGYANAKGINIDNPERVFKSVLSQVAVPSSFETVKVYQRASKVKTACFYNATVCSAEPLCTLATRNGKWDTNYRLGTHAKEAKRRRLSCGVK